MNIGQASKQSGISTKMIRYYEQIGLLEPAKRTDSGYRIYSERDLKPWFYKACQRFRLFLRANERTGFLMEKYRSSKC